MEALNKVGGGGTPSQFATIDVYEYSGRIKEVSSLTDSLP